MDEVIRDLQRSADLTADQVDELDSIPGIQRDLLTRHLKNQKSMLLKCPIYLQKS